MGGDVLSFLFFLAVGVVSGANPQTLELMLSPRNPFGGFSSWLVLCLGANPPCFRYLKEITYIFNGF